MTIKFDTLEELNRAWSCKYCIQRGSCRDSARDENCVYQPDPEYVKELKKDTNEKLRSTK
jgi:hypothetical protein